MTVFLNLIRLQSTRSMAHVSILLWLAMPALVRAQTVISVNPEVRHQTMSGWEAVSFSDQDSAAFPLYREELFRRLVNEAGINRLRLEVRSGAENSTDYWTLYQQGQIPYETWRANRYATVNDNGDSSNLNPGGFHFSELDNTIEKVILPVRSLVAANGESLYVNLNYVAFTAQITAGGAYHHANPAEYAEFMLAVFQHMDGKYGFVPDAIEIILEPDNVSQWSGNLIGRAIVATKAKLAAAGYSCEFIAPSCTNMGNAVTYFDALVQVAGAASALNEICYHRYGGVSDTNLRAIESRARQRGMRTSMLEWWSDSNGHAVLLADLKVGGNSAWQHGAVAGPGAVDNSMSLYKIDLANAAAPIVRLNRKTQLARQYYRFVRKNAVRFDAQTTLTTFDPIAFLNPTGEWIVIVKANAAGTFKVRGLPAGTYGLNYSTPASFSVNLAAQVVPDGGELSATMPRDGVMTIFSKTVQLSEARLANDSLSLKVRTLAPGANVVIEKTATPADPNSWVQTGSVNMGGILASWSEPVNIGDLLVFYRARLP